MGIHRSSIAHVWTFQMQREKWPPCIFELNFKCLIMASNVFHIKKPQNRNNKSLPVSFYISAAICQQIMNVYINKWQSISIHFFFFFFKDICRCAQTSALPGFFQLRPRLSLSCSQTGLNHSPGQPSQSAQFRKTKREVVWRLMNHDNPESSSTKSSGFCLK